MREVGELRWNYSIQLIRAEGADIATILTISSAHQGELMDVYHKR